MTYCIDPRLAKTGEYYDEVGSTGDRLIIYYEPCSRTASYMPEAISEGVTCLNDEEMREFYDRSSVMIEFFESKTKIDFSARENYKYSQMEWISRDFVEKERWN